MKIVWWCNYCAKAWMPHGEHSEPLQICCPQCDRVLPIVVVEELAVPKYPMPAGPIGLMAERQKSDVS